MVTYQLSFIEDASFAIIHRVSLPDRIGVLQESQTKHLSAAGEPPGARTKRVLFHFPREKKALLANRIARA